VRVWARPGQSGVYTDLLWCFRDAKTSEEFPVGLVLGPDEKNRQSLQNAFVEKADGWKNLDPALIPLLEGVAAGRLSTVYGDLFQTGTPPRLLGQPTVRTGTDTWGEAIAWDVGPLKP
jgi:hypothetical protein